ncbi:hypothetical protein AALO_G00119080 [Alosa alosa]|uniref:Uncharacterized protein n=1 Tax=Alosa alosa TaxID=278164 RepID=A0AAV6GVG6_9TELE|nr:hypothetical protein AALO_G00119080 [Alosa alosa]
MPAQTLNVLSQLRNSQFGRPKPRHGLRLLFWFANDFVGFDYNNQMVATDNPAHGSYGFKPFHNRIDNGNSPLLPHQYERYYEVGNLNQPKALQLPSYVRQHHTNPQYNSNTDRLIVVMGSGMNIIDRVYVTQHSDRTHFSSDDTFRISQGLIDNIRRLDLDDFLAQMGEQERSVLQSSFSSSQQPAFQPYTPPAYRRAQSSDECPSICEVVAFVLILFLFLMLAGQRGLIF